MFHQISEGSGSILCTDLHVSTLFYCTTGTLESTSLLEVIILDVYRFIHIFNLDCWRLHERVLINLLSGFYNSDSGSWMFV